MTKPEFLKLWKIAREADEAKQEQFIRAALAEHVEEIDAELHRIAINGVKVSSFDRHVQHLEILNRLDRIYTDRGFRVITSHPTLSIHWTDV